MVQILFKRGNTAQNDAYTGPLGSITIDTQLRKLRIHDGVTPGGHAAATYAEVQAVVTQVNNLAIANIAGLQAALDTLTNGKVDKTTTITAGNGLTGGGDLSVNRTLTLGTPGTITSATTNSVSSTSHTHALTVTKSDVGLGNVDNTSDLNKPISTATQTALDTKVNTSSLGVASGVATLDAGGKIPLSQLSDSVLGQVEYMGTWNASTNTPTLATPATTANKGNYYVVSVAGTQFTIAFAVGDWIISNGSTWEKVDNTDAVTSVAGRTGAITLTKTDVGLANVDNTSDASKPVSTAQQTALNLKANLASPTFTGVPAAPTATAGTSTTQIATTAFVTTAISALNTGVSSVSGTAPIVVGGTAANPVISISAATTAAAGSMSAADKTKLDGIAAGAQVNTVTSVAGKTGAVTLVKGDVGLGNVDNYTTATNAEALAGALNTVFMTAQRTKEFVTAGDYTIDLGTF